VTSSSYQQSGFRVFFKDEGIQLTRRLRHRSVLWTAAALLPGQEARSAGDDEDHPDGQQGWPKQGGSRAAAVHGGFATDSRASQVSSGFGIKVALKKSAR